MTTSTPVPTHPFPLRGINADDFLAQLDIDLSVHKLPYRVFLISGDTRGFYRSTYAVFCRRTRALWMGTRATLTGAMYVPPPFSFNSGEDAFHPEAAARLEQFAAVRWHIEQWLKQARLGPQVSEADTRRITWRELLPAHKTVIADFMPETCTPVDYWDGLAAMGTARTGGMFGYGTSALRFARLMRRQSALWADRMADRQPSQNTLTHWRGMTDITARKYLEIKRWFRDPAYSEAVRCAREDGDCEPLMDYIRSNRQYEPLLGQFIDRHSDGELILASCGHVEYACETQTTYDGDHTYCAECADEYFVICADNGQTYHRDDVYYWDSDGEYHLSAEPEEDDDDGGSDYTGLLSPWGASTSYLAHDRSFTPSAYGDFTMGIELEVETEGSRSSDLRECYAHFNYSERYAMFKRDGSLSESYGFEIVTAARRMGDHIARFKSWDPPSDLRAWNASNCGMHVHIDSRAFTALHLGRFLQLYNDPANRQFIRAIAGRHPDSDGSAGSYAQRLDKPVNLNPATIKKGAGTSRYRMVNLTNLTHEEARRLDVEVQRDSKGSYSTVEIRVFRASLKKERLLAQIEFAHASVAYTRVAGNHQLNGKDFLVWLGTVAGQYKHLARWFNVYVPRPTKQRPTVQRNNVPEFV